MNLLLEIPISKIREALLLMSSLAERNCADALKALHGRDDGLAEGVETGDSRIDQLEMEIDEEVITYMATRGPVATDCRFALAASKISSNLERIGDEATTIARRALLLNQEPPLEFPSELSAMSEIALKMLRDSIGAFIENTPGLALEIIARDRAVDRINRQLTRELTEQMKENDSLINRCLNLMRVVKSIERIADHAANIAEDVYYLHLGRDIRHGRVEQEYETLQPAKSRENTAPPAP
jgi:phosphate transport system protein